MTKLLTIIGLGVLFVNAPTYAQSVSVASLQLNSASVQLQMLAPLELINWKVGDSSEYDVTAGFLGKVGTSTKTATKEEGNAIWMKQEISATGQHETVEALISRTDGKILKFVHNGKEEAVPQDDIKIISQDYTEVTVPAGTFKCLHIVAKTKQVDHVEIWANPVEVALDGTIKQQMASPIGVDIVMELTKHHKQ